MIFGEVKKSMKKTIFVSIVCLASFYLICNDALSWDDKVTHKDLSKSASDNSVLGKGYLANIGLNKGLDNEILEWAGTTTIKKGSIKDWLAEGAQLEDSSSKLWPLPLTTARFKNHFHNAANKDWPAAGLSFPSGESALLWAQDGTNQTTFIEGDWSWKKVRDLYLLALTSGTDSDRQAYFAQTFRGLGHQMHLIQDMSQPDHVRNDAHPLDALIGKYHGKNSLYIETWAKENSGKINGFAANPVFPTVPYNVSYNGLAPITQLFDTRQYSNNYIPSVSLSQGLAEYTNANFFSEAMI